jgi:NADPH-dependent ferric siderophore reductase
MAFSQASVVETIQLTPRLRRIALEVDDPAALDVTQGGDSAVAVYFPHDDDGTPASQEDEGRNCSVRRHTTRGGVDRITAVTWARGARPGHRVGRYWRFDSETWDAEYVLVADTVEAVWARALREGRSARAADEEFDEALERAGLKTP